MRMKNMNRTITLEQAEKEFNILVKVITSWEDLSVFFDDGILKPRLEHYLSNHSIFEDFRKDVLIQYIPKLIVHLLEC